MKKKDLKEILTSFPVVLAYCHLARIFRPFARRKEVSFLAVLVVPSADLIGFYCVSACKIDPFSGVIGIQF